MQKPLFTFLACGALALACDKAETPAPVSPAPTIHLMPGMAVVDGHTLDVDGKAVAGATITVAETGAQATSDTDGHWNLMIGGDTTVNLRAEAMGFARTLAPPLYVSAGSAGVGVDLIMVTPAKIGELNKLTGKGSDAAGVIAVQVRSRAGGCMPAGGKVALNPAELGKIVYADGGAMEDPALAEVQEGSAVAAWIAGMTPPGAYSTLTFQKDGCHQVAMPVQDGALTYMGMVHVEAGALSQAILFVE